jgi:hypothetical protein
VRAGIDGRLVVRLGIYAPKIVVHIEGGQDVDQLHIGLPIRINSTHILPIFGKAIGKQPLALVQQSGQHMLAKVGIGVDFLVLYQGILQNVPVEDVDAHVDKVVFGLGWLFFKFVDAAVVVGIHNAVAAGFLPRDLQGRQRDVAVVFLVIDQHGIIIHLVDMVAGED